MEGRWLSTTCQPDVGAPQDLVQRQPTVCTRTLSHITESQASHTFRSASRKGTTDLGLLLLRHIYLLVDAVEVGGHIVICPVGPVAKACPPRSAASTLVLTTQSLKRHWAITILCNSFSYVARPHALGSEHRPKLYRPHLIN